MDHIIFEAVGWGIEQLFYISAKMFLRHNGFLFVSLYLRAEFCLLQDLLLVI